MQKIVVISYILHHMQLLCFDGFSSPILLPMPKYTLCAMIFCGISSCLMISAQFAQMTATGMLLSELLRQVRDVNDNKYFQMRCLSGE